MDLRIKYWVEGHEEFEYKLGLFKGHIAWVELPRDRTPELREHHITIEEVEA